MSRYFAIFTLFYVTSMTAQTSFVAHRGASYLAPENTVASTQLAWDLGAYGAECDVMLTKDQKVVVFHDSNGKRLLGTDHVISETNYDVLKELPIKLRESNLGKYEGQTMPLLEELLKTLPYDRLLVIEIKCGPEIIPFLETIIQEHWTKGKIAFIAFGYETIIQTKATFPEVPCYYLSSKIEDINARFDQIAQSKLEGVDLAYKVIDKTLVDRFKQAEKEVWCWTVNTLDIVEKMKAAGVECITTDRPAWLKDQLSQR